MSQRALYAERSPTVRRRLNYALLAPAACFLAAFALLPFLLSLRHSFLSLDLQQPGLYGSFIGFENYQRLRVDPLFYRSLTNTALFIIFGLFVEFPLGFLVAAYLQQVSPPLRRFVLAGLVVPMVLAPVAVGLMWKFLINPQYGVLTYYAAQIGIDIQNALSDQAQALWTVRLVDVWQWMPFTVLLSQACLTSVPRSLIQAAAVDGLPTWMKYRYIIGPWVLPTMTVAVLLRILEAFKIFDIVFVLTEGGPGNATEMVTLYAHRNAFVRGDYSYAAAYVVVLNAIVIVLCLALQRVLIQAPATLAISASRQGL